MIQGRRPKNRLGGSLMWTNENRARYDRSRLRYPSDLTDAEWAHVGPFIPPAKRGGNRRHVDEREVVDGLMSCPEHRLPMARRAEGPAAAFDALRLLRSLELGRHAGSHPRRALREVSRSGRSRGEPDRRDHRQPERQERGKRGTCIDPAGYDAGKKIMGKKHHILVDTQGLLMHAIVHAADIQDRDGGAALMATLFGAFPFLTRLFADGGYRGATAADGAHRPEPARHRRGVARPPGTALPPPPLGDRRRGKSFVRRRARGPPRGNLIYRKAHGPYL